MIRDATPDDVDDMVYLGRVMHAESPRFRALDFDDATLRRTILRLIELDEGFAKVAERSGVIVGYMLGFVMPLWFGRSRSACDLLLFIAPEYRGSMLAARLLNAFAAWAKDAGAAQVQFGIMTGVNTDNTVRLCERLGWRQAGVVMEC